MHDPNDRITTLEPREKPTARQLIAEMRESIIAASAMNVFERLSRCHNTRECLWKNQQPDGRLGAQGTENPVFRWPGAPDLRIRIADKIIRWLVVLRMSVYNRGDLRVGPHGSEIMYYTRTVDAGTGRTGAGDVRQYIAELGEMSAAMKRVQGSRVLSPEVKRARLMELARQRNRTAEAGFKELFPPEVRTRHYRMRGGGAGLTGGDGFLSVGAPKYALHATPPFADLASRVDRVFYFFEPWHPNKPDLIRVGDNTLGNRARSSRLQTRTPAAFETQNPAFLAISDGRHPVIPYSAIILICLISVR